LDPEKSQEGRGSAEEGTGACFMSAVRFSRFFVRLVPGHLFASIALMALGCVLDAITLVCLLPLLDMLVQSDLQQASFVTRFLAGGLSQLGLPVTFLTLVLAFWAMAVLASLTGIAAQHMMLRGKYRVIHKLILGTSEDILSARWEFFSSGSQGTLLHAFNNEVYMVGEAYASLVSLFVDAIVVAVNLTIPLLLCWQVTLISVTGGVVLVFPLLLVLSRVSYRLGKVNTQTGGHLASVVHELVALAKVTLSFGNQQQSISRVDAAFESHRRATLLFQTVNKAVPYIYKSLSWLVLCLTLYTAIAVGISLAETAIILLTLFQTLPRLGSFAANRTQLDSYSASIEHIQMIRERALQMQPRSGTLPFTPFHRELHIKELGFAYQGRPPLLVDVNLRIARGSMVAIVGPSGAGKSTLVDLIIGLNQPTSGVILFDDTPLQQFDQLSYRRQIGYVPQESVLFNLSIRDNLRWAHASATDEEIRHACEQANAIEFIDQLPDKFDTVVGDRGTRLSGGQVQRLALARAILRKPVLLILDEATSSLDSHSERLIQQAVERIARETTVLVIAHRLSTIMHADQIVVLQHGRVVEQDTYQTLVARDGFFNQMVQAQVVEIKS
jgi:ATP-binding cassette subfamily B protein